MHLCLRQAQPDAESLARSFCKSPKSKLSKGQRWDVEWYLAWGFAGLESRAKGVSCQEAGENEEGVHDRLRQIHQRQHPCVRV